MVLVSAYVESVARCYTPGCGGPHVMDAYFNQSPMMLGGARDIEVDETTRTRATAEGISLRLLEQK